MENTEQVAEVSVPRRSFDDVLRTEFGQNKLRYVGTIYGEGTQALLGYQWAAVLYQIFGFDYLAEEFIEHPDVSNLRESGFYLQEGEDYLEIWNVRFDRQRERVFIVES